MTGYPDWQTYAKWQGDAIVSTQGTMPVTGTTTYGPFSVKNYQGLLVHISGGGVNHQLYVYWYADEAGTFEVNHEVWDFSNGESMQVMIPALAPYVIIVSKFYNDATSNLSLWVAPSNVNVGAQQYQGRSYGHELVQGSQAVGATSAVTDQTFNIYGGPATLVCHHAANSNWHVFVRQWDSASATWQNIVEINGVDYGRTFVGRISLPARGIQVQVSNNDSASQHMSWSLISG